MLTVIAYLLLQGYFDFSWSRWLLVLPVITDLALIELLSRVFR